MENDELKKQNMSDHDLLITMHEQIKNIRTDIKEIKDGTSMKIDDHEERLRAIEKFMQNWNGKNMVFGVILMFLIGLLGNFFTRLFP